MSCTFTGLGGYLERHLQFGANLPFASILTVEPRLDSSKLFPMGVPGHVGRTGPFRTFFQSPHHPFPTQALLHPGDYSSQPCCCTLVGVEKDQACLDSAVSLLTASSRQLVVPALSDRQTFVTVGCCDLGGFPGRKMTLSFMRAFPGLCL